MKPEPHPLQILGSLIIDYFRWSQLTPMILMWFGMLGLLLLLLFVNNQEATWSAADSTAEWIASLPLVGPWFVEWMDAQAKDGGMDIVDLKSAALSTWAALSLVFMLIGWIAGFFFGPFKPWTLKLKIGLSGVASLLVAVAFVGLFYVTPELSKDPFAKVLSTGIDLGVAVFLVSGWCLSIAHLLGKLGDMVAQTDISSRDKPGFHG